MVNNLVKQKFTLEAAEDTSAVFETLSLATATSKNYLKGTDHESMVEELKNDLAEVEAERAKMDSFFAQGNEGEDEDLLRELNELSLNEKP